MVSAKFNLPKLKISQLSGLFSPGKMDDLNVFLEKLPTNAGNTVLIAAAISWIAVGILGLFTTLKASDLNNLRAQLQDVQALKPIVPSIQELPVESGEVANFAKKMSEYYKTLAIGAETNKITISSTQTSNFSLFREAVNQAQVGGAGWKLALDKMCVGRECTEKPLTISLKINRITIDRPESDSKTYLPSAKKPVPTPTE